MVLDGDARNDLVRCAVTQIHNECRLTAYTKPDLSVTHAQRGFMPRASHESQGSAHLT